MDWDLTPCRDIAPCRMCSPIANETKGNIMRKAKAFTLVEILIVVVLLGVLAAIVVPAIGSSGTSARETSLSANLKLLRRFILVYTSHHLEVMAQALVVLVAEELLGGMAKIGFGADQVLGGRGDDVGGDDAPLVIELILVDQGAARRLDGADATAGADFDLDELTLGLVHAE